MPSKVKLCDNQTTRNVSFQTELFSSFMPSAYAGHVNLATAKHWQFMPNWKDGSTVELIVVRVQDQPGTELRKELGAIGDVMRQARPMWHGHVQESTVPIM